MHPKGFFEIGVMAATRGKWIAKVKTNSTHPAAGLFTKSARTIANSLASKRVSPEGPRSGMRMLTYFVNRAGRALSTERRAELERAKELLSRKIEQQKKIKKRKTRA
jgi:hypothetical protein